MDANPWLRIMEWAWYLDSVHPQDLRWLVEAPGEDARSGRPGWGGLRGAGHAGYLGCHGLAGVPQPADSAAVRTEAVRAEADQTPYQPLQAYMDETSVQKHVRPWQQVLAFIARTQASQTASQNADGSTSNREWLARLPVYGMTPRQRQKWQVLWQLAMPPAAERPDADARTRAGVRVRVVHTFAGAGQIIEDMWDASPSPGTSDSASAMEVEGEEGTEEMADTEVEAWQMTTIEQACLEFCVELMNQRHRTHEYEGALVCAMALQGWGETQPRQLPAHIIPRHQGGAIHGGAEGVVVRSPREGDHPHVAG